jgi:hypothetical protein
VGLFLVGLCIVLGVRGDDLSRIHRCELERLRFTHFCTRFFGITSSPRLIIVVIILGAVHDENTEKKLSTQYN